MPATCNVCRAAGSLRILCRLLKNENVLKEEQKYVEMTLTITVWEPGGSGCRSRECQDTKQDGYHGNAVHGEGLDRLTMCLNLE